MKLPACLLPWLLFGAVTVFAAGPLAEDDFSTPGPQWIVEQQPGGTVTVRDGALEIEDAGGCTVWWRAKLSAPVVITYDAELVAKGGPHDRVSDLNCFWMATDPRVPGDFFAAASGRSGKFETYDRLSTYYVGQGGNDNTTTRFRRYGGDGTKPLQPEFDRRGKRVLLEGNRVYHVKLAALADGTVQYWRDDELIFSFRDPAPLRAGWFGIRTVQSHLKIRHFRATRP